MTDKFVSVGTLILVVNDEGEAVEGTCHLVADDDTGPNIMATTRQAQFAATWASVGKKHVVKYDFSMYGPD